MRTRKMWLIGGVVAAMIIIGAGTGIAVATGAAGDDDGTDVAITGDALQQASDAALAHTGQGTVTETEVGDEESYYEVEVTLDDGSQVDVQLDENFKVVSQSGDNENGGEDGGGGDD